MKKRTVEIIAYIVLTPIAFILYILDRVKYARKKNPPG